MSVIRIDKEGTSTEWPGALTGQARYEYIEESVTQVQAQKLQAF
jgi:hypothetical protein